MNKVPQQFLIMLVMMKYDDRKVKIHGGFYKTILSFVQHQFVSNKF